MKSLKMSEPNVTLEIEGNLFPAHRQLLASKSLYFEAMFSGHFKEISENTISIKGITPRSMQIILGYLTNGNIDINEDDILQTLQAACMLQVEELKNYCIDNIISNLNSNSCIGAYFIAVQLDLQILAKKSLCIALQEFNNVIETDEFLKLSIEQLHCYLAHCSLHSESELDVFEAAIKWWYEKERNESKCLHETNSDENFTREENLDYCTTVLLIILQCIDFNNVKVPDIQLILTYPGICQHSFIKEVLNHIISIKNNSNLEVSDLVKKYTMHLLSCKARNISKLPCSVGILKCDKRKNPNKKKLDISYVVYYDSEHEELKPLVQLQHVGDGEGPDLEGYQVEVWKDKILVLGGEYMYGSGDWSKACWIYDTTKEKWSQFTVLPSVRRHFKTCVVGNELYVVGGTGRYRVVQNNMDCYNLKTDTWTSNIHFPYEIHNVECCEYNNNLYVTCGGRSKIESFVYDPKTLKWIALKIYDPKQLYKQQKDNVHSKTNQKNFKSYVPFVIGENLYICGNYLLGLKQNFTNLEVFYFGPGVNVQENAFKNVGLCVVQDTVHFFCSEDKEIDVTYNNLICTFSVVSKQYEMHVIKSANIRLKDSAGCFSLFHYSALEIDNLINEII